MICRDFNLAYLPNSLLDSTSSHSRFDSINANRPLPCVSHGLEAPYVEVCSISSMGLQKLAFWDLFYQNILRLSTFLRTVVFKNGLVA